MDIGARPREETWCKKDTQFTEYLSDQFVRNMDGELVGELDYGT